MRAMGDGADVGSRALDCCRYHVSLLNLDTQLTPCCLKAADELVPTDVVLA